MAWVFENWWQVLIVVWFGGVLEGLLFSVFKYNVRLDMQRAPFFVKLGVWIGPFFWPLQLLQLLAVKGTNNGARIEIGQFGMEVHRGLNARRLLEDLTAEFPLEPPCKHVLSLGIQKGELTVYLGRWDGSLDQIHLTPEDQVQEHDDLVDGICDFVDLLDEEREAESKKIASQDLQ